MYNIRNKKGDIIIGIEEIPKLWKIAQNELENVPENLSQNPKHQYHGGKKFTLQKRQQSQIVFQETSKSLN